MKKYLVAHERSQPRRQTQSTLHAWHNFRVRACIRKSLSSVTRARLRFARRMCEVRQIPKEAARGTDQILPWRYDRVIQTLEAWNQTGGVALDSMNETRSTSGVPGSNTAEMPAEESRC